MKSDIYQDIADRYKVCRAAVLKRKRISHLSDAELEENFRLYAEKRDSIEDKYVIKNCDIEKIIDKYEPLGIPRDTILRYRSDNPEITYDEMIEHYDKLTKQRLLRVRAKEEGIDVKRALAYLRKHKEMSIDDIIKYYKTDSLKNIAIRHCIKPCNLTQLLRNHPEMSIDDAVNFYIDEHKLNNKELCEKYGLSYMSFCTTKNRYKLSVEETINRLLKYKTNFKEVCKKYGLDYEKTRNYKKNHNCSYECAILHFRPDLYLNSMGEIVSKEEN